MRALRSTLAWQHAVIVQDDPGLPAAEPQLRDSLTWLDKLKSNHLLLDTCSRGSFLIWRTCLLQTLVIKILSSHATSVPEAKNKAFAFLGLHLVLSCPRVKSPHPLTDMLMADT